MRLNFNDGDDYVILRQKGNFILHTKRHMYSISKLIKKHNKIVAYFKGFIKTLQKKKRINFNLFEILNLELLKEFYISIGALWGFQKRFHMNFFHTDI